MHCFRKCGDGDDLAIHKRKKIKNLKDDLHFIFVLLLPRYFKQTGVGDAVPSEEVKLDQALEIFAPAQSQDALITSYSRVLLAKVQKIELQT